MESGGKFSPDIISNRMSALTLMRRHRSPREMQRPPEASTSLHTDKTIVKTSITDNINHRTEHCTPLLFNTGQ